MGEINLYQWKWGTILTEAQGSFNKGQVYPQKGDRRVKMSHSKSVCKNLVFVKDWVKHSVWGNKPQLGSASIKRQRCKSPLEAKDKRRESYSWDDRSFHFTMRVLTHKFRAKPWQKANVNQDMLSKTAENANLANVSMIREKQWWLNNIWKCLIFMEALTF